MLLTRSIAAPLACLLCLIAVTTARAQRLPLPARGDRIRVTLPDSTRKEGVFAYRTSDSLAFVPPGGSTLTLPVANIRQVEIARGTVDHETSFALTGASVGLALGGIMGMKAIERQQARQTGFPQLGSTSAGAVAGALVGALGGAILGDLIGRQVTTARWIPVQ